MSDSRPSVVTGGSVVTGPDKGVPVVAGGSAAASGGADDENEPTHEAADGEAVDRTVEGLGGWTQTLERV